MSPRRLSDDCLSRIEENIVEKSDIDANVTRPERINVVMMSSSTQENRRKKNQKIRNRRDQLKWKFRHTLKVMSRRR